ncbi:MAG: DUF4870 domain-containing protein [Planctomycetes bacterium]|nr:DUF4870 domain-containing protein [Planctomycetota bacterium]
MPDLPKAEEKQFAMFCHLASFAGSFFPAGNIVGPLVLWLIKKDEMEFVDDQGTEVLNFQISITIYSVVALLLVFVVIGIPLLIGLVIFDIVVTIIGAVKANAGERYRYPLSIPFIAHRKPVADVMGGQTGSQNVDGSGTA